MRSRSLVKETHLEVSEFQHALNRGLGRAILHLQKHDSALYRAVLLQACLTNTTYDRQVEGGKSVYMMSIINLTGEKEYYRQHILNAARKIDKNTASYDREHVLDLVQCFAQDGDSEARQIIYDAFTKNLTSDEWDAFRILELDGIAGFLFVAEKLGQQPVIPVSYSEDFLLSELEEQISKSVCDEKLAEARLKSPLVDKYLKHVEAKRAEREQNKTFSVPQLKRTTPSYADLKQRIEMYQGGNYHGWGKRTDPDSLIMAANDLLDVLRHGDNQQLRRYMQIFALTPFPLDHKPIIKLINDSNEVTFEALNLLRNISHSSIRQLALKLVDENRFTGRAVALLNRNFEDGDWQLLEEITQRKLDDEDYHSLELSIRKILDNHPTKDAIPSLLNLYENGICSHCRYNTVENLHSMDALPDFIREECLYDSYEDTRELAKRNFEPKA